MRRGANKSVSSMLTANWNDFDFVRFVASHLDCFEWHCQARMGFRVGSDRGSKGCSSREQVSCSAQSPCAALLWPANLIEAAAHSYLSRHFLCPSPSLPHPLSINLCARIVFACPHSWPALVSVSILCSSSRGRLFRVDALSREMANQSIGLAVRAAKHRTCRVLASHLARFQCARVQ